MKKNRQVTKSEAVEAARRLLRIADEQRCEITRLLAEVTRLNKRDAEAREIISGLLAQSEARDTRELILKLRPKAQQYLAAQKAARARKAKQKATTEQRVWDALLKETEKGTPERAHAKRIASDLHLSQKQVRQTLRRFRAGGKNRT